jgi:hypothetical protein
MMEDDVCGISDAVDEGMKTRRVSRILPVHLPPHEF